MNTEGGPATLPDADALPSARPCDGGAADLDAKLIELVEAMARAQVRREIRAARSTEFAHAK